MSIGCGVGVAVGVGAVVDTFVGVGTLSIDVALVQPENENVVRINDNTRVIKYIISLLEKREGSPI